MMTEDDNKFDLDVIELRVREYVLAHDESGPCEHARFASRAAYWLPLLIQRCRDAEANAYQYVIELNRVREELSVMRFAVAELKRRESLR